MMVNPERRPAVLQAGPHRQSRDPSGNTSVVSFAAALDTLLLTEPVKPIL